MRPFCLVAVPEVQLWASYTGPYPASLLRLGSPDLFHGDPSMIMNMALSSCKRYELHTHNELADPEET